MPDVYIVKQGGTTERMERIHCRDETRELQDILEHTPQLLPGDQIGGSDGGCRWLLIKREMPVPDPSTGEYLWNVDFFFVDQNAIPTFVECKRFKDTDSRRKIVGQVLDYAANGSHYWTKDMIQDYARESAPGNDLDRAWQELRCNDGLSVSDFFARVEENLNNGEIRIVFFLDEAPRELKSIVAFLTNQMKKSKILLVEARQYSHNGVCVIVPSLFGYTEQACIDAPKTQERVNWDWDTFKEQSLTNKLDASFTRAISLFHDAFEPEISFGTGKTATFNLRCSPVSDAAAVSVNSFGVLSLNFGCLTGERACPLRDGLKEIAARLGLEVPDDYKNRFPSYRASIWAPRVEALTDSVRQLFSACSSSSGESQ